MHPAPNKTNWRPLGWGLTIALWLSACSDRSSPVVQNPSKEVRGQPINSAPGPATIASASAPAPTLTPSKVDEKIGNFSVVGFDKLGGYTFTMPNEIAGPATNLVGHGESSIPASLRALDKKPVAIKGFMLPLKVQAGVVTEMLIMKDQSMCCYGTIPRINDWVSVKMKDKGVRPIMDQPVTLFGTMHVGEMRENGYLIGIYELTADKMEAPEE